MVGTHEPDHVKTFTALLGSAVIKEPSFNFAGVTGNSKAFRGTAVAFEDLATGANKEQAPLIQFREATDDRGRSPAASPRCRSEGRPSRPAPRVRRHGRVRGRRRRCSSCLRGSVLESARPEPPSNFGARRATVARSTAPSAYVGGVGQRHRRAGSESRTQRSQRLSDVRRCQSDHRQEGVRARARDRGWEKISAAATALITNPPTNKHWPPGTLVGLAPWRAREAGRSVRARRRRLQGHEVRRVDDVDDIAIRKRIIKRLGSREESRQPSDPSRVTRETE